MDLNAPIISNNVGTGLVPVLFIANSPVLCGLIWISFASFGTPTRDVPTVFAFCNALVLFDYNKFPKIISCNDLAFCIIGFGESFRNSRFSS